MRHRRQKRRVGFDQQAFQRDLFRDAAKEVPLERMLIETDSPFLAPVPHRGKRNEPVFVKEVARQLGELRGLSTEEVGRQTAINFYNFFKLTESPGN